MLSLPKIPKSGEIAVVALIVLLPLSFFCYQAWFNPQIEFLVPSFKGRWILHSSDMLFPDRLSGTILFRRQFELTAVPREAVLAVRAASRFRLSVNGHIVEPDSRSTPGNWKFARTYDIAQFLAVSGNVIEIRVTHARGLPALMVQASSPDGKLDLGSDDRWESAPEPYFSKWRRCVYTYREPPVLGGEKSPLQRSRAYPAFLVLLGVYALFIVVAVNPWRLFYQAPLEDSTSDETVPRDRHSSLAGRFPAWTGTALVILVIAAILAVNIHNVTSYPYSRSRFDAEAHVDYVKYVASHWQVPLATQGWEMYQPPLYYFISAAVYTLMGGEPGEPASLKAVQVVGMLSGLACLVFAWLILRICLKGNPSVQMLGLCTAAFLPMVLYVSPTISNETFSASMMSLSLYLLMRYGFRDSVSFRQAAILGAAFGLALLSKYTALLFFLVALGVFLLRLWIRSGQRRREAATLLVFVTVVCAVCGWFYVRNAVLFHQPFVANWDEQSGFRFEQPPGYRTPGFYLKFGAVFTRAPERSRWTSFWDGYYGSMWMDTHFNMMDYNDDKASSYGTIILGLALLPSAAMLWGLIRSLKRVFVCRMFGPDLALAAIVFVTMLTLVWYTLKIPYITTLKAFYSLSLLPAFAAFSGFGLREMAKNLRKFSPFLYLSLFALFVLIGHLFWYRSS